MNVVGTTAAASTVEKSVSSKDTKSSGRSDDNEFASALKSAGNDDTGRDKRTNDSDKSAGSSRDQDNADQDGAEQTAADTDSDVQVETKDAASTQSSSTAADAEAESAEKDLGEFLRSLLDGDQGDLDEVAAAVVQQNTADDADTAGTTSRSDIVSQLAALMAQAGDSTAETKSAATSLLKKLADAAGGDDVAKSADDADDDTNEASADQLGDMMALLAMVSQQTQAGATDTSSADGQAGATGKAAADAILATAGNALSGPDSSGDGEAMDGDADSEGSANSALFRSLKTDTSASDADLVLPAGTVDSSSPTDADMTASDDISVQVLESRRFLGVAQDSNASSIARTIADDADWSTTLEPGSKIGNSLSTNDAGKLVQTLKIQLNPLELGTVDATLRLVGDDLTVHLTVNNGRAFHELSKDSSTILDALRNQGLTVDNVSVSLSTSSDKNADSSANGRQASDLGQQAAQQQGERQSSGRQSGQTSYTETTTSGSNETSVETSTASSAGDARPGHVYI